MIHNTSIVQAKLVERRVDLEDLTIHYLEGGKALDSKYPILLLHGWVLSAEAFRDSLSILSQNYRVIAPDLPGFGKSNHSTGSWSYDDYAKSILSFMKALDLDKVHLIGHSTGGGICIVLAASVPSKVRSLILVDSTGIPIGSFSRVLLERLIELPLQFVATRNSPQHSDLIGAAIHNFIFRTKNTSESINLPLKVDLRPLLSRIETPCLIMWGENDRTIPLSSGQELSRRIKGAKIKVIEKAHHEWSILLPGKFAQIISDFIVNRGDKDD